ncbi:carbon starvation protein A [Candidatus Sulfidibacterium hydrothermale]|uniref:carbon starvation CstA family protein n=1 Tax=Candidatus Sulfidibacterium hydrothermale TaxID=2875962 RepID=UPI001F0B4D5C|nr:carbon starvation protein A [Candidatus Sulfidibacterium hydrothermale]UBM61994.1 carbon starvation protein A [Candidatus Sulfidibacterium hydrothermale]
MESILIMVLVFAGYLVMYRLYGKFIGNKIFKLNDDHLVPSVELEDGVDYVPTKKNIIFGHHFASIAGTGPIVGPAIAVIWGWLPALIWVFLGSLIMGGVHDLGTLVLSMRNQGKSISEFTAKYINVRTKYFFFFVVFLELWIVVAIFGLVIAILFKMYPQSVIPVWSQIPIAMFLGYLVYKRGANLTVWSIIAVVTMYLTIVLGSYVPLTMPKEVLGISSIGVWSVILLAYAFTASVLPVTKLLQPRDYINAHQLIVALSLLVLGVIFAGFGGKMHVVAPVVRLHPKDTPPMWPFLFITIACGAISGFHSLVSSGTSAKQVRKETDSLFVGYGSMLLEGALATLVIIATTAGIGLGYLKNGHVLTGVTAWTEHYASWAAAGGLSSKVGAFVEGAANMIETMGIPKVIAMTLMGVFVASFAGTTMDTATRVQRYLLTETFPKIFSNKFVSTAFVIGAALLLIFSTGANGKGALSLWPLFGAVNQTLAALALIVVTIYLRARTRWGWIISALPAVFMLVVSFWAAVENQLDFENNHNLLLEALNLVIIISMVWVAVEGVIIFFKTSYKPKLMEQELKKAA